MSAAPLDAVAFDLGGVLVDVDKPALSEALGRALADVERAFFRDDLHDRFNSGAIAAASHFERAARELSLGTGDVVAAWRSLVRPREGAAELVERTHVRVTVWSNTDEIHTEVLSAQLPARLWRSAALSWEVGAAKPAHAFFGAAVARLRAAPERVLFLDDREDNVAAARAAGVRAERVRSLEEAEQVLSSAGVLSAAREATA
jgi:HAD superfamily hydrolase (TIGR01509 family)